MTKNEAGRTLARVALKLEIIRSAAENSIYHLGRHQEDLDSARKTLDKAYAFADAVDIMLKGAVENLREIEREIEVE